ncbi:MAG: DNA polymerase III subunit delta' [Pirellulaceae bacterium]
MSWDEIKGHDEVVEDFRRAINRNRLASSFLLVGPASIGKRMFALQLAQTLLCGKVDITEMAPCGICEDCQQVKAQTHPDLLVVQRPKDRTRIPIELLIGEGKNRMREGLCHDISLRPYRGRRKVAIIDDADYLNQEGANCLLKTLEEPPSDSVIILISESQQRQLPTIRSRCQIIRFAPLPESIVAELLLAQGVTEDPQTAHAIAARGKGSLRQATQLADEGLEDFREVLLKTLAKADFGSVQLAKDAWDFVQKSADDAPQRRQAIGYLIQFALDYYRAELHLLSGSDPSQIEGLAAGRHAGGIDGMIACLDRCIEAEMQLDSNANLASLIEGWIDDLATASRTGI